MEIDLGTVCVVFSKKKSNPPLAKSGAALVTPNTKPSSPISAIFAGEVRVLWCLCGSLLRRWEW